jgi:hypothetical protein
MTDRHRPNDEPPMQSPNEAIETLAAELDGVVRREVGKAVEFDRAGVVFATREADRLSFRLRSEVVAAALHTPDTATSARGADWIVLVPAPGDPFSLDRAAAWFESAWRLAGEQAEPKAAPH